MPADEPLYSQADVDALTDRVAGQQRLVMALIGFLTTHHIAERRALLEHLRRFADKRPDLPGGDVFREICDILDSEQSN